jgi:hypothetical protein
VPEVFVGWGLSCALIALSSFLMATRSNAGVSLLGKMENAAGCVLRGGAEGVQLSRGSMMPLGAWSGSSQQTTRHGSQGNKQHLWVRQ